MDFRIAPMIMALFNFVYLLLINPDINPMVDLQSVASIPKMLIPFLLVFAMSIGSFLRHSYYSRAFKVSYMVIQLLNIILLIFYIYSIKRQNLV